MGKFRKFRVEGSGFGEVSLGVCKEGIPPQSLCLAGSLSMSASGSCRTRSLCAWPMQKIDRSF